MFIRWAGALSSAAMWAIGAAAATADPAPTQTVTIYAAGSLKTFVASLAEEKSPLAGLNFKPTFAAAGLLRAKIEAGAKVDLFLSADMNSPRKLAAEGQAFLPPVAFARNRMCFYAPRRFGVTADNLVARLLLASLRIRASAPGADPSGDYAVAIFDRLDRLHPGTGKILRDKADVLRTALKGDPPGAFAAEFKANRIDAMIAYCSADAALEKDVPDLEATPFPTALDPAPVFGLVVLTDRPAALKTALFVLSEPGQALLRRAGLIPLLAPNP
ncbi:MAG: substrate-binding domain-containing protein [Methylovirgula sp.]|uniref:substrate-binding domain-containing protein n=1 Tax=Methylovirgula sp. TaxID=1978224 RepID=UPI003076108E